jgi:hypothetical protein
MSLSRDFKVAADTLHDIPLGIRHKLHGPAASLLHAMQSSITFSELLKKATASGVTRQALTELVGFLNTIGALELRRNANAHIRAAFAEIHTFVQTGVRYPRLTERHAFSARTLALSIIRTCKWVLVACTTVGLFFTWAIGTPIAIVTGLILYSLLTLLCSTFVHEYAHYVVLAHDAMPVIIIRRGMRLGLIHQIRTLSSRTEMHSAIAGPVAGTCFGLLSLSLVLTFSLFWLAIASAVIVVIHLAGLLPWYGDGQTIMRLRSTKEIP